MFESFQILGFLLLAIIAVLGLGIGVVLVFTHAVTNGCGDPLWRFSLGLACCFCFCCRWAYSCSASSTQREPCRRLLSRRRCRG